MLGLFNRRRASSGATSQHARKKSKEGKEIVPSSKTSDPIAVRQTMANAEREIYQFETPTQELGLSDLIKKHKEGDRFQYVALTGSDPEGYEARLRRLVTLRPRMLKTMIPINKLPHIRLIEDSETFDLSSVLPKRGEDYIRIHSVSGYFSPLTSVMSTFSKVKISLMDSRYSPPNEVQSIIINSNIDAKIELSMDFCIPRASCQLINLMITREQATISHGHQWGAIQLQLSVEESSFPSQSHMKNVVGILAPTVSALEEFTVSPNTLDISMTETNRKQIREMYQAGDIADEDEPIRVKKAATKYAKSTIRGLPKGNKVEGADISRPGFEHMKGFRKPQVAADEVSEEPEDYGSDEELEEKRRKAQAAWEEEQEKLRKGMPQEVRSDTTEEIERPEFPLKPSIKKPAKGKALERPPTPPAPKRAGVRFGTMDV